MDLDNLIEFKQLDTQNYLAEIEGLPDQLQAAWELGLWQPLPAWNGLRYVMVAGMGGSAIGADLASAYLAPVCPIPILVHRDYDLPAWARGPETLLIASSHSGNTEETLSAYQSAMQAGCQTLVISTGGKLADLAHASGLPCWQFQHHGQPRAAVGFSFGLILAALYRLGLVPDPSSELNQALAAMREQALQIGIGVPAATNLAKRMAGQLMGRWVTVIAAGYLAPVARRWKGQINELAKAWAHFEFLPETDHNSLAGMLQPEEHLPRSMVLFLRAHTDHPRNRLRTKLTRRAMMLEGIGTDIIDAAGATPLENIWTALQLGDYIAYYLAMSYGTDPTPITSIAAFKLDMGSA